MKTLYLGEGGDLQMKLFILGLLLAAVVDGELLDVETQENMTAVLGGNVTFNCTTHLEDILQVTWQKINGQSEDNIATFSDQFGFHVLGSFIDRVDLIQSGAQVSSIVLSGVGHEDEGCYQCVFTSFRSGQSIGTTCFTVHAKDIYVETQVNVTAVLGENVTFNCTSHVEDVLQVTWQRLSGESEDNIATFGEKFEANFFGSFIGRATFVSSKMQMSTVVLSGVKLEDEGCYQCVFHTSRSGRSIGKTCLTVHAHTKSQLRIWIISIMLTILLVIAVSSLYWYKKRRHQQKNCQT
ncbi:OX-2 membrane glycoprotein isoform X2 [Mustelus asterias]